jgi:MYND finger protein
MSLLGPCRHCKTETTQICGGCQGDFYCSRECQVANLEHHRARVPFCGKDRNNSIPAIVGSARDRRRVIDLLNSFTEDSIREAIELLNIIEPAVHPLKSHEVTIVMGDDLDNEGAPCKLHNRACNDGLTLWISRRMLSADPVTTNEIGFKLPDSVRPWAFVILHEFAHILMGHSFLRDVEVKVKETRANYWAARYITF